MSVLIGNAVVGQSGGPTSAINATLSGVIRKCIDNKDTIKNLYGMKNGMEGFLREDFIDLFSFFENGSGLDLLEMTPASALGSCRMKLPSVSKDKEIYERIFEIFKKHNIRYFFYIGGNDSMDTVLKLSNYAREQDYEIRIMGVPKTIDNDLAVTDHSPGYGSCAKYIATVCEEMIRDISVYTRDAVTIVEIMGRDAGWLTASAGLCGLNNGRGADLIYLPEVPFSKESFICSVRELLKKQPTVFVAVSEGLKDEGGSYITSDKDNVADVFGHKYLSGVAKTLSHLVKREIGCKVRAVELNLPQRAAAHIQSKTDISESVRIGKAAVKYALDGRTGCIPVFKRKKGKYAVKIECAPASFIANGIKSVPRSYVNEEGNGVTKECIDYILPLVKGEISVKYKDGLPLHCIIK